MKITAAVVLLCLLCMGGSAFGQSPVVREHAVDFYVGYVNTSLDYGPSFSQYFRMNGFSVQVQPAIRGRLSGIIDATVAFRGGGSSQFSVTAGPRIDFLQNRPVAVYVMGQAGYARQASHLYDDTHTNPLAAPGYEAGFTSRFGGGLEIGSSRSRLFWRVVQADLQTMPWGRHGSLYLNLGSGVGLRF